MKKHFKYHKNMCEQIIRKYYNYDGNVAARTFHYLNILFLSSALYYNRVGFFFLFLFCFTDICLPVSCTFCTTHNGKIVQRKVYNTKFPV